MTVVPKTNKTKNKKTKNRTCVIDTNPLLKTRCVSLINLIVFTKESFTDFLKIPNSLKISCIRLFYESKPKTHIDCPIISQRISFWFYGVYNRPSSQCIV